MDEPRVWHTRGYLPHYDDGRTIQTITYRLADALPSRALQQLEEQTLDDERRRLAIEHYLDAGHGSCELRDPRHAQAVRETWQHSNGSDYRLHAWVIMPNHVHVMIEPRQGCTVGAIVGAWKRISSRKIQRIRREIQSHETQPVSCSKDSGPMEKRPFWQVDYYDRFIRNENHYRATIDYIHENPVKAGFVATPEDWPWSSASRKTSSPLLGTTGTAAAPGRFRNP